MHHEAPHSRLFVHTRQAIVTRMGVSVQLCAVLVLASSCVLARPSDADVTDATSDVSRASRATSEFKPEHRASPADTELLNLPYYGGAEGNVLVYHPTLGLSPALKPRDEEGGEDSVTIQPPPKTASVAEVRPVGLAIAGIGGVAASKPTGTAVVGPGGLAIARPIATAIAGVPPDAVLGPGPEGPGQQEGNPSDEGTDKHIYHPAHVPVAVGPSRGGTKYGVIPMARSYPVNYVRVQPNSIQYTQQPLLLYPIAFY